MSWFKQNKIKIMVAGFLTVLPSILGLVLYDFLLSKISEDFLVGGARGFLNFGILMPLILLAIYALMLLITARDNKHREQSPKVSTVTIFICPAIALYTSLIFVSILFGLEIDIFKISALLFALLFIVTGNYMPKCKPNFTIGIKTHITLANSENWNATHRFAGKVFVACGIASLFLAFIPGIWSLASVIIATLIAAILPTVYSYLYYKKQLANGTWVSEDISISKPVKKLSITTIILTVAVLAFCAVLSFIGDVTVELGDDSLTLGATLNSSLTISYSDIDSIELRDTQNAGARVMGYGSSRMLVGTFKNDEFALHTRYTYAQCDSEIVLKLGDKVVVFNAETPEQTEEIYNSILLKIQKGE